MIADKLCQQAGDGFRQKPDREGGCVLWHTAMRDPPSRSGFRLRDGGCVLWHAAMRHTLPHGRVSGLPLAGASRLFSIIHWLGKIFVPPTRIRIGGAATRDRI